METVVFINDTIEAVKQTYYDKDAVLMNAKSRVEAAVREDPEFLEILLKTKEPPFYYGKEKLWPFYGFWLMHKNSIWSEHIHYHLLVCQQGELERKVWNSIIGKPMFPEYSSNLVNI
ncbi:uncharacterized protein LOC111716279 [Eurytemora carolleeae]|uniref:uncharacterized protein LOC111716279 n=1 Tax=Eurytemora carolleeae TaxID=1294199 RepID=UPI000C780631|nr:uncharacterized protein LOC111716279 [Eurytemora carolleeae]|eukprot:XP_023347485.1 uncharacterized protein LOC111716279 [Eurytemora affinis]